MNKKLLLAAGCSTALLCCSMFLACSFAGWNSGENGVESGSGSGTPVDPPVVIQMTFDDLVSDHTTVAKQFCEDYVMPQVVSNVGVQSSEIIAESISWRLSGSEKNVTSATMSFISNLDETNRALWVATADFQTPVLAQDVADRNLSAASLGAEITAQTVFEFDAKANYNNTDITSALYTAARASSTIELYYEAEENNIDRVFNILELSEGKISITNLNVTKGDGSKETLIKNLSNRAEYGYRTTSTVNLSGVKLSDMAYTPENLGGSVEEDGEETPTTPSEGDDVQEEEKPVTNADIIAALDEYCLEALIINAFDPFMPFINTINYVKDGQWFVTKNEDGYITKAEYLFRYQKTEKDSHFIVCEANFYTPLNVKNITNEDIQNATYTKKFFTSNYNPTIQEENAEFTNALCDKIFGENPGAMRFMVDQGGFVDPVLKSETQTFGIIEISNSEIKQCDVMIKYSSSYEQYLSKLDNASNYRFSSSSSYTISGEKVEA